MLTVKKNEPGTTLLDSLIASGIEPEYQCRNGFCGACRVNLIEGDVTYTGDKIGWTEKGQVLPCVCEVNSVTAVVTPVS